MLRNLLLIVLYLITLLAMLHIKNVVFPGSIDLASLNAKKLKAALDQRGISYTGVVEIQELRDLLKNSGGISYEELESALGLHDDLDDDVSSATHFTSYVNFDEETEEMKNSVWVVHVYDGSSNNFVSLTSWKDIVQKLSRVGIRTGYFDCSLNKRFCRMKNVKTGSQSKVKGKLEIYTGPITPPDILRWINSKVEKQVDKIYTSKQLQNWLNFDDRRTGTGSEKVKILLLSKLNTIPLFYSVLAVKFSGRVKFGVVSTQTMERRLLVEQLNFRDDKQTFVVMTPETNYTYGYDKGEYFTFAAMSFFLRALMPQISDVTLFSFVIVQLACCLSFATSRGSLSIRLQQTLWNFIDSNFQLSLFIIAVQEDFLSDQVSSLNATLVQLNLPLKRQLFTFAALCVLAFVLWAMHFNIIKWICMSVLLWLPVFGLFQILHWMNLFPYILALLRRVSLTRLVSSVRVDLLFYSTSRGFVTLVVTFLVYALIVSMISSKLRVSENNIANDLGNTWWLPNALPTVLKCLRCLLRRLEYFHGTPPVSNINTLPPRNAERPGYRVTISPRIPSYTSLARSLQHQAHSGIITSQFQTQWQQYMEGIIDDILLSPFTPAQYNSLNLPLWRFTGSGRLTDDTSIGTGTEEHTDGDTLATAANITAQIIPISNESNSETHHSSTDRAPVYDNERRIAQATPRTFPIDGTPIPNKRHKSSTVKPVAREVPIGMFEIDCTICQEDFTSSDLLCGLPCGHSFHKECIAKWLTQYRRVCPNCRVKVTKYEPSNTDQHIDNSGQFDSDQDDNNIYLDDNHMDRDHDSIYQDDDNGDQNDANTEDDQEEDDNNDQDDDNIDQDDENMHVYSDDDSIYLDNDNMDQHDESICPDDDDISQNDGNINLDDETINQGGNDVFLYDDYTDQDHDSVEQHDDIIYLDDDNMGL